jgi:hypothetical protein
MLHSRRRIRNLLLTAICLELLLVLIYATDSWVQGPYGQLHSLIDLDAEGNLPAWFSSFQLALIAIAFWRFASRSRATQRPSRRFLQACGGFFLLLSIDETALLHERVTESLGSRYIEWVPGYLSRHPGKTTVCALVLFVCFAAACPHLRGFWRLSRMATAIGATGCAIYATGAAVLETFGFKMLAAGVSLNTYRVEVAAEEFLEMLGGTLILYAVLLLTLLKIPSSWGMPAFGSGRPRSTSPPAKTQVRPKRAPREARVDPRLSPRVP